MRNSEIILLIQFLFSFHLARILVILGASFNYIFLHSYIKLASFYIANDLNWIISLMT